MDRKITKAILLAIQRFIQQYNLLLHEFCLRLASPDEGSACRWFVIKCWTPRGLAM